MKMKQQNKKCREARKRLSVLTAAALLITSVSIPFNTRESKAEDTTTSSYEVSSPTTDDDGVTTWDCIYFGNYWQNDTNGDTFADQKDDKEPIKWRVLSVDGDDAFLLADRNLDCQKYDETWEDITWETCTLRTWLNGTFLSNAFSEEEQAAIKDTTVVNDDNPSYSTEGGENTTDKVYLLSTAEASNTAYGFNGTLNENSKTREAKNTVYARECGAHISTEKGYKGNGDWWLRSPGSSNRTAAVVSRYGWNNVGGNSIYSRNPAVRPVLHVDLSASSVWRYAGKVTSKGEVISSSTVSPTATPAAVTANPTVTLNNPALDDAGVTTWDCVYFGNYWQNDTNSDSLADQEDAKEPIKWRVLSVDGDDAFLLADRGLDCQKYNETEADVTWKTCTLRTWLNGTFLSNAFSEEEQAAIKDTMVVNDDNSEYETEGGETTTDKVYLLSIAEAGNTAYGFSGTVDKNSETREAKNTVYARECEAYISTEKDYKGNCDWWLRSPGSDNGKATDVASEGWGNYGGNNVSLTNLAVRPVLHVDLSASSVWRYAGTVTAKGEANPLPTATETPEEEQPAQSMAPSTAPTATGTPAAEQPTQSMAPSTAPTATATSAAEQPAQSMAPSTAPTATATSAAEQSGQSMAPTVTSTVIPTVTPSTDDTTKTVVVPSVKLKALKVAGGSKSKVKVTWKKAERINGYRLQYAQNKKFRKKLKTKLLTAEKTSVTLKDLKKKKTYYVRIRAYVLSDGKKVYGKWSNVKKIKVKK